MRVLLLGGTADGRELAGVLRAAGHEVIESVAGRTAQARAAAGRVGGFGGVEGLAAYLQDRTNRIDAVVDATHPFAAQISWNAAEACAATGTRLLRFLRAGWQAHRYADDWTWVGDHAQAAAAAAQRISGQPDARVLLTVGRQPLPAYRDLRDVIARVAEWLGEPVPAGWRIIVARGPFTLPEELELMRRHAVTVLVSKDSGGDHTAAKLDAAHQLAVPVVMVKRPAASDGVEQVSSAAEVVAWLGNG